MLPGIPVKNDYGIKLKVDVIKDQLVYELKIPLNHSINNGFFVNATPGSKIRLGFEEGKFDRVKMRQEGKENRLDEGRGENGKRGDGMREGYGGGIMGRSDNYGGHFNQNSSDLNTWFRVSLSRELLSLK